MTEDFGNGYGRAVPVESKSPVLYGDRATVSDAKLTGVLKRVLIPFKQDKSHACLQTYRRRKQTSKSSKQMISW